MNAPCNWVDLLPVSSVQLSILYTVCFAFSALTLLVGRQEGHPACKKTEWWGTGVVMCLERGADLHTAQLMPLPLTFSCFSEIQIGSTFLVPAHLGSPGKRAVKRVCVFVFSCVFVCSKARCEVSAAVDDIYGATYGKYCGPLAVTSPSLSASYSSVLAGYHDVMSVYDQRHVINNNNNNNGRYYYFRFTTANSSPSLLSLFKAYNVTRP